MKKRLFIIGFLAVLLDFAVKFFVKANLVLNDEIIILKNFFSITFVKNFGAAWSTFLNQQVFLIAIGFVTLVIFYNYLIKSQNLTKFETTYYAILLAGIVGNMIDRILYGFVIDYLDFKLIGYDFPVFNLADIFIVCGTFLLTIKILREDLWKTK